MVEFTEFYITCNPPLLYRGVEKVILLAINSIPEDILIEILYEPDIAWLKVITVAEHEIHINEMIETFIQDIYSSEDVVVGEGGDLYSSRHFCSWDSHLANVANEDYLSQFRVYMTPESLKEYSYCDIFRDVQQCTVADSIDDLLSKLGTVLIDPRLPKNFAQLKQAMKTVTIEHNMRQNLVYIASDCKGSVKLAKERLKNLVDAYSSISIPNDQTIRIDHVIFATAGPDYRYKVRRLMDLGLAVKTYCAPQMHSPAEYHCIMQSHSIGRLVRHGSGQWRAFVPVRMPVKASTSKDLFSLRNVEDRQPDPVIVSQIPHCYRLTTINNIRGDVAAVSGCLPPAKRQRVESSEPTPVGYGTSVQMERQQTKVEHLDETATMNGLDRAEQDAGVGLRAEIAKKSNEIPGRERQKSTAELRIEESFVCLTDIVSIMRGLVVIRVQFGRIYLRGLPNVIIEQPPMTVERAEYMLQYDLKDPGFYGFSSVLSSSVTCAYCPGTSAPAPGACWCLSDKKISYVALVRATHGVSDPIEIEIDSHTMDYIAVRRRNDFFLVYMHQADSDWDARLHGYNTYGVEEFEESGYVVKQLVGSLKVSHELHAPSMIFLEFSDLSRRGHYLQAVTIKHTDIYTCSADTDIQLRVAYNRQMERRTGMIRPAGSAYEGASTSWHLPDKSVPGSLATWVEAEIRSQAVDASLKPNMDIREYGNKTNWSAEGLCRDGRISAMCSAAAFMLPQMDCIGALNDNSAYTMPPAIQAPATVTVRGSLRR